MRPAMRDSGTAAVTPSFSSVSSEQVEYTRTPPGASAARALASKADWRAHRSSRSSGLSRHLISGLRPRVPVPEQGASTSMRSKRRAKGSGRVPSSTTRLPVSGLSWVRRWKCKSHAMARTPASRACAVCRFPATQEPLRAGELDCARGPQNRIAIGLARQGVDEARGGGLVGALHQFDRVLDGGMGRNALQVANLVESHAQGDALGGIELARTAGMVLDQEIELTAVAQHAENDLRGQPGIARVERGGVRHQEVRGIASRFHLK